MVLGATGFLGKRVCRLLEQNDLAFLKSSLTLGLDLRNLSDTLQFFEQNKITKVINCAAYVGSIQFGESHSADLFRNNLLMTVNLLEAARQFELQRIVNPVSNCAYPARATLFKEEEFWDGPLHESVLAYGFARKASWVGSWAYQKQHGVDSLNLVLSNMYGPEDHFSEKRSHALGALIMRMANAKRQKQSEVVVWGTGNPVREWLHVDDGAEALVRGLNAPSTAELINIGVGAGITVKELAALVKKAVGFEGQLVFDPSKPDGAPFKTVDGSKGAALLNWKPTRNLETGIQDTVNWYLANCGR